eukprot:gene2291-8045_t
MARKYDVIVFGASGFTGSLVAEYLAQNYIKKSSLSWAVAGRDEAKLKKLLDQLAENLGTNAVKEVDILVADANDFDALQQLAEKTKVVLSTTGPFWKFGSKLIEACVNKGTSYCDITGESPWVREMMANFNDKAKENRCRIVNLCGMDSVPSDVGCYVLANHMKKKHNCQLDHVNSYVITMRGGVSGGTIASMMNIFEQPNFAALTKELGNPYELVPKEYRPSFRQPDANGITFSNDIQRYTSAFVMAGVNSKVVHRTNHLLGNFYGTKFKYCEKMASGKGTIPGLSFHTTSSVSHMKEIAERFLSGIATTLALGTFVTGAYFSWTRPLLKYFLPKPGDGPDKATRESGKLVMKFFGVGDSEDAPQATATFITHRDPGYAETAKMVAESAICLSCDSEVLPERWGFLTPMAAMGEKLITRLQNAGIEIFTEPQDDMAARL